MCYYNSDNLHWWKYLMEELHFELADTLQQLKEILFDEIS